MSNSLWPPGLQHTRLTCPSLYPGVCSDSYPLSRWCHPTISSSVVPSSSCPQSFPASGSFPMTWLFTSGGQSTGPLASASVLPMNIQGLVFTKTISYHIYSSPSIYFLPLVSTFALNAWLTALPLEKKVEASRWTLLQPLVIESVNFMPLPVSFPL